LLSRVEMLTGSAPNKMTSFRSAVRQFRNSESGAKDLVDTVFNVLDRDVDATTGVVREVASLFDNDGEKDKQQALLSVLNAFRIEVRSSG
jgi:predicted Zn-dependent protease with MMP-like domain